jgi:hypothetical protein
MDCVLGIEIKIDTSSYNQRRYGKPWIAVVDFSKNAQGEFKFGEWVGDWRNGSKGVLIITASTGDIVARGQKDNRNNRNSAPEFYKVAGDGTLERFDSKADAYNYVCNNKPMSKTDLLKLERELLGARIIEIDKELTNISVINNDRY